MRKLLAPNSNDYAVVANGRYRQNSNKVSITALDYVPAAPFS